MYTFSDNAQFLLRTKYNNLTTLYDRNTTSYKTGIHISTDFQYIV